MNKDILNDFDISGLDKNQTVVRCSTRAAADTFLKYLCAKDIWNQSQVKLLASHWTDYGDTTCYHLNERQWCNTDWYMRYRPDYVIVEFEDIYIGGRSEQNADYKISFDEVLQGVR